MPEPSAYCIGVYSKEEEGVNVQWIPAHLGLERNAVADQEAKRGSMLLQSSAPMDLTSATEALKRHQRSIAEDR